LSARVDSGNKKIDGKNSIQTIIFKDLNVPELTVSLPLPDFLLLENQGICLAISKYCRFDHGVFAKKDHRNRQIVPVPKSAAYFIYSH
jgi:hypothetical protein